MSANVHSGPPPRQGVGEDPLTQYTRIFTRFLQLVFASFESGGYRWNEDDQLTEVIIQGEGTVNREVVEKRPAIIVARGAMATTNISMDQFAGPLLDPKTGRLVRNRDDATGARRHTDLLSASMTYNCLSSQGLEAQRLAWTCFYATRTLKRALMRANMHRVGEDMQVGSESQPGALVQPDAGEIIMVSVAVPFFFQQTWTVAPEDKTLLAQVSMALNAELNPQPPVPWVPNGPGMNGRLLSGVSPVLIDITVGTPPEDPPA